MAEIEKTFSPSNAAAVIGAIILVGSEIFAAAGASAWAFAGIFRLGDIGFYGLAAAFGGLALWTTIAFAKQALKTEPLFAKKA